jgi:hypothetical protein
MHEKTGQDAAMTDQTPGTPAPFHDHAAIVQQLYARLLSTTKRLGAYVDAHGELSDREDETFAFAGVALGMARESGLIEEDGSFSERFGIVPLDDEFRQIADPIIPDDLVHAGMEVCDRMHADHMADAADEAAGRNPDPDRTDWDDGMLCVGIYRAMTRRARCRPVHCRLETSAADDWTEVSATSYRDAARVFGTAIFHAAEGEWMGGKVIVVNDPEFAAIFGEDFDVTIDFDDTENRDLRATAVRCAVQSALVA